MIYTCPSLLICKEDVSLHLCSACPRGHRSSHRTSGCYCMHIAGHASCLLPLATAQKGGIQLQGGAGLLGECWRQTSQSNKVLQTFFLQPARQQELSCLAHGIRQTRRPARHDVPVGRERDTNVHHCNTCFLFGRQQKNTAKACW